MAIYDTIGQDYNNTRKADPYITNRLYDLLQPVQRGTFLDIGCGTGNYLTALTAKGLQFYGVDPSDTMLAQARKNNGTATFIKAPAENIPFPDYTFDGAIGTFTMHHWDSISAGLGQLYRVLKPTTRFVTLSFTPQQMTGYWLYHYFPEMIERSMKTIPAQTEMEQLFYDAGFSSVSTEKYFVADDLQDHFLYSNKHKPEQYLLPEVRNNISSFKVFSESNEIEEGLLKLESDINTGAINTVINNYKSDMGDYIFYIAEK